MAQDAERTAVPGNVTDRAAPLTAETAGPRGPAAADRRWWVLGVVGLAQLMVVLDATIVNIALPSAQQELGFSNADRQWVVTAYSLAFGSLLLLGDRLRLAGSRPGRSGRVRRLAGTGGAVDAGGDLLRPGRTG